MSTDRANVCRVVAFGHDTSAHAISVGRVITPGRVNRITTGQTCPGHARVPNFHQSRRRPRTPC